MNSITNHHKTNFMFYDLFMVSRREKTTVNKKKSTPLPSPQTTLNHQK